MHMTVLYSNNFFFSSLHLCAASYLYPSFQGLMSDNDTVRLGLDFQRMLRINHMLYIAARSVTITQLLIQHNKRYNITMFTLFTEVENMTQNISCKTLTITSCINIQILGL